MSTKAIVSLYQYNDQIIISPSQPREAPTFISGQTFMQSDASASAGEFGEIVWQALHQSAELPPALNVDPVQRDKEWETAIAGIAGTASYQEFQRDALLVMTYWYDDDDIDVASSIHEQNEYLMKRKEIQTLASPSPEALGAAIKSAFANSE